MGRGGEGETRDGTQEARGNVLKVVHNTPLSRRQCNTSLSSNTPLKTCQYTTLERLFNERVAGIVQTRKHRIEKQTRGDRIHWHSSKQEQ